MTEAVKYEYYMPHRELLYITIEGQKKERFTSGATQGLMIGLSYGI